MRKVVIHRPGGYERLALETHPDPPPPGEHEVLVATRAIGVNYADCVVRMGLYASAKKYVGWPITPGFEFAGTVQAVGAGVRELAPGARVFGVTRFGGYATHVTVPHWQLRAVPDALTAEQAAGFPAVHLTAYYALCELARPRAGASVLVHSAAGGVGSALVQIARAMGCRVVGVVGATHKVQAARALGCDAVVDKSAARGDAWWREVHAAAPGGYDVVLDANGVATLRESYRALRATGRLVVYGFHSMLPRQGGRPNWAHLALDWARTPRFSPLDLTGDNKSVMGLNLSYLFEARGLFDEGMAQLLAWLEQGRVAPPAVRAYPLERVADAHRAIESGQTVGKLVLAV